MDNADNESGDSDHSSDFEVDPVLAARAALLVARFAAAIQATKELQALQNRPQLLALEKLVLECIDKGDAAFLNQKRIFRMMPPPLKEKINRELSVRWRCPPLVGELMDSHTRHLSLELDEPSYIEGGEKGWTFKELDLLCDNIEREGKTSLRSLEIESTRKPEGTHPGLHLVQVGSLLLELRALTSLHLACDFESRETGLLLSALASTNPEIRSLRLPHLSNRSLGLIAHRWPQLEALYPDQHEFDSSELAYVLPGLRNLETLQMCGGSICKVLSEALLKVARAHDPASPPYKLAGRFTRHINEPVSSGDMVKVLTVFPALYWLDLLETDIPAVCAGLEGREHVHITDLDVEQTSSNPRALEPLLARVGEDLTMLRVAGRGINECIDLNMIGHYCPKLQTLEASARQIISSDEYQITQAYFSKLKLCNVNHCVTFEIDPADLPIELVCRVLASPTLESFECEGVPITEEVVAALAAERGRGALSSLEGLAVWHPSSLDVGVLAALASHAPRLQRITLGCEDSEDEGVEEIADVLRLFMQQSGLNIFVSVEEL